MRRANQTPPTARVVDRVPHRDHTAALVAVVALLVSLAVAGFAAWQHSIAGPAAERLAQTQRIAQIVTRVGDINRQLSAAGSTHDGRAIVRQLRTEKIALVSDASTIIERADHQFSFSHYLALASEFMEIGDMRTAVRYFDMSRRRADTILARAEATWGYATALAAAGGDPTAYRAAFSEALELADMSGGLAARPVAQNAYQAWILSELRIGDCAMAQQLFAQAPSSLGIDVADNRNGVSALCQPTTMPSPSPRPSTTSARP